MAIAAMLIVPRIGEGSESSLLARTSSAWAIAKMSFLASTSSIRLVHVGSAFDFKGCRLSDPVGRGTYKPLYIARFLGDKSSVLIVQAGQPHAGGPIRVAFQPPAASAKLAPATCLERPAKISAGFVASPALAGRYAPISSMTFSFER